MSEAKLDNLDKVPVGYYCEFAGSTFSSGKLT